MPKTAIMSIIIPVVRIICNEFLICHQICFLHNPSDRTSVERTGDKHKRCPQNNSLNIRGFKRNYLHLDHTAPQIYICVQVCPPSVSYPNHTHAHRVTLKANQTLKGFSLGARGDRLVCGDH